MQKYDCHNTKSSLQNSQCSLSLSFTQKSSFTVKQTKSSYQIVTLFSWPPALNVEPKDLLNKGPMVTIFGIQSNANLECAVDQLATNLASLNLPTVIFFGPRFKSDRVCDALKNSQIKDQVSLRWIYKITAFKEKKIHYITNKNHMKFIPNCLTNFFF
jgi:hypothetical protein